MITYAIFCHSNPCGSCKGKYIVKGYGWCDKKPAAINGALNINAAYTKRTNIHTDNESCGCRFEVIELEE